VLTISPWTARNWVVMDAFVPVSTEGGHTLAGAYNGTVEGYPLEERVWQPPWSLPDFARYYWRPAFRQAALENPKPPGRTPRSWRTGVPEPELDRRLSEDGRDYVLGHPGYVARKAAFNAATLFELRGPSGTRLSFEEQAVGSGWARRLAIWGFYPVLVLAIAGAFTARARRAPKWLWVVPIVFLPAVFIDSLTRFRAPIDPFLIMLAALALDALADRRSRRAAPATSSASTPAASPAGESSPAPSTR
jgi:hypothetical protein